MCGIAGLLTATGAPADPAVLEALGQAMAHRGPDGVGYYRRDNCGFVHMRLAIIDLVTGDQPLYGPDGLALVGNGEIYNNPELRAELAGAPFVTKSDCEPPLYLYLKHGLDFATHLRGMYAIAIHDPNRGRLVLARDPFGIKPLYYADTPQGFVFASEPQAILATGLVARKLRTKARDELLNLQFTTGPNTIFSGIRRLMPGETIVVEKGHIIDRRRIEALPSGGVDRRPDVDLAAADLDKVLEESVAFHQRADVPYGMFLSGGIDSSAVLALMARLNSRPVLAYTAFFPGTRAHDESAQARAVAKAAGAHHIEVPVTEADFWADLPAIAAAMDDPVADYAIVPTIRLAAEARKSVKVILSGEGGDELFGGYGRYRGAMRPWPFAKSMRRSGNFEGLGVLLNEEDWREGYNEAERAESGHGRTRLQAAQALDCADWLPNDLLIKLDRCLMACGVEGRVPFLDPEVAKFAYRLPDRLKVKKGLGKWLLRSWLAKHLPQAQPFAEKRGFTVPVQDWIAARPDLGKLVAAQPSIREFCQPDGVERLFRAASDKRAGFAAWTLLFYALWHRRHIRGEAPVGDVFETLNAA